MGLAVVKVDITPLCAQNGGGTVQELLCGEIVEVLRDCGEWCEVKSACRCEGRAQKKDLIQQAGAAQKWAAYGKLAARAPFVDVLCEASTDAARIMCLPRGGLVHPLLGDNVAGFIPVGLPDGGRGYAKPGNLMLQRIGWKKRPKEEVREALAATAMSYLGTQYRRGGNTPLGMDAGGLICITCLLNGVAVWRGEEWRDGSDFKPIARDALDRGDVLYFCCGGENHAALYLGDGMYIHSTAREGSDGVVLNSLSPKSPFYQKRWDAGLAVCASLF